MKQLTFFLFGILVFVMMILTIKIGLKFLYFFFNIWYVSLPLVGIGIFLIYQIIRKKSNQSKKNNLDPANEIKLDKEPQFKDLNSNDKKDDK